MSQLTTIQQAAPNALACWLVSELGHVADRIVTSWCRRAPRRGSSARRRRLTRGRRTLGSLACPAARHRPP
jgi:hypothetical protein